MIQLLGPSVPLLLQVSLVSMQRVDLLFLCFSVDPRQKSVSSGLSAAQSAWEASLKNQ